MTTPNNPTQSIVNSISQWNKMNHLIQSANNAYKKDVNSIYVCMTQGSLQPGQALWMFQTQALPLATQSFEYDGAIEAVALGIANILRETITDAQNNFSTLVQNIEKGLGGMTAAQNLMNNLKQLSSEIHAQINISGGQKMGLSYILGGGVLKNMSQFIANIMGPANKAVTVNTYSLKNITHITHLSRTVTKSLGNKGSTRTTHYSWKLTYVSTIKVTTGTQIVQEGYYTYLKSLYDKAVSSGQPVSDVFGTITTSFNNLNQTVSGISSSIQAQMQYLNNNLQTYLGVYKNFFDDYANLNTYLVNKQKPS